METSFQKIAIRVFFPFCEMDMQSAKKVAFMEIGTVIYESKMNELVPLGPEVSLSLLCVS
jgi:hypothetical protein